MTGTPPEYYQQEDSYHEEKLHQLKERILKFTGGKVKTYSVSWDEKDQTLHGMEELSDMVVNDIRSIMEQEWKDYAALTPYQQDQQLQLEIMHTHDMKFHAREEKLPDFE